MKNNHEFQNLFGVFNFKVILHGEARYKSCTKLIALKPIS